MQLQSYRTGVVPLGAVSRSGSRPVQVPVRADNIFILSFIILVIIQRLQLLQLCCHPWPPQGAVPWEVGQLQWVVH